jgi:hypothetical protein
MPKPSSRKARKKPPRCVLLDTRAWADFSGAVESLERATANVATTFDLMAQLVDEVRRLIPIVSELHAAQQRRSAAARRANETRRAQAEANGAQAAADLAAAQEEPAHE